MLTGILLYRNSPLLLQLAAEDDTNLIWLRNNSFVLCIVSEIIFRKTANLKRVIIYTGFENLIKDTMVEYSDMSETYSQKENNELIALRSYLNYFAYENISAEGFYWKLININNPENTKNRMYYQLQYRSFDIYVEESDTFFDFPINVSHGPLIACSSEFKRENVPDIFTKELFRDIIELDIHKFNIKNGDKSMYADFVTNDITHKMSDFTLDDFSSLVLVEGETTKNLYLFYPKITTISQDSNEALSTIINDRLDACIKTHIFPRKTFEIAGFETKKYCKQMSNGQYRLSGKVESILPNIISPYNFTFEQFVNFSSLENLNMFWIAAGTSDGFDTSKESLRIYIERNDFCHVKYFTTDLIKAISAENLFQIAQDLREKPKVSLEIVANDKNGSDIEVFYNYANSQYMRFVPRSL